MTAVRKYLRMSKFFKRRVLYCLLLFILIVATDQITKMLVVRYIPRYLYLNIIDGFFRLTYVRNTGASFSMLSGYRWLFLLITPIALIIIGYMLITRRVRHPLGIYALVMISGGTVGNYIDRIAHGYVVDMLDFYFVNFAIFNVADTFITIGCLLFAVYIFFFNRQTEALF